MLIFYVKEFLLKNKFQQNFNLRSEWISQLIWPQMCLLSMSLK